MSQSCCSFAFLVVSLLGAPAILAGTISIPATSQVSFQESQSSARPRNVGQTFVVPSPTSESLLTDFSFNITNVPNGDLDYEAYLFQWNPGSNAPIGGALFQSGMQTAIATGVVQFTGLNLSLNPALTYVALLSTQGPASFNDNEELGNVGSNATAPYAGGAFVRQETPTFATTSFTSEAWQVFDGGAPLNNNVDLEFTATFVVPEPSTSAFLILSAIALLGTRRRRLGGFQAPVTPIRPG